MSEYNIVDKLFNDKDITWKPSHKIPLVKKEIEQIKLDLKEFYNKNENDITAVLNESEELCNETKCLISEIKSCKHEIENETLAAIDNIITKNSKYSEELKSVNFALNIVSDVILSGRYVKEFDDGREAQSFTRAVEAVYDLLEHIESPVEGFDKLDLYINTKNTAQLILDNLIHDLYQEWDRMVSWTVEPSIRKTVVTISITMDESHSTFDIINALHRIKKLNVKVSQLAQFLVKDVLIPIIHNDCLVYGEPEEMLSITVNHKTNRKPDYDAVISNLRLVFHYLSSKLITEFYNSNTIMAIVGQEISEQFSEVLINDCLIDTVPNNVNELQNYSRIISEIEDLQHFLTSIKFFPDKNFSILDYVNDIDRLFADKSSQYFLETARTIMLKDLSMTTSIGVEHIPENPISQASSSVDANMQGALDMLEKTLPSSLFYFPRCMVSKTTLELLDLVYLMMEQAVQCSDVVCKKLYITSRLVFELYEAVVPYHHENYLQTIPQYVAIFHNNCMYLAHHLQTLGNKWLVRIEGRQLDYPLGFVDLVQKIRELGYKHLTIHMQQQRKQILDNVRSSDLNSIAVKDVLSENAEAAIRQCLRQLQLLKNVWIGVFPSNVFTRLMATLVNMFLEELVHRVCTVEDISMEIATQLTDMYTLVMQKTPQLFQSLSDVEEHVKSWVKLQELIFILGGSLKDIENHWNDGTGPLAIHFRREELRSLIKALFQNTQFRANLLSKIK